MTPFEEGFLNKLSQMHPRLMRYEEEEEESALQKALKGIGQARSALSTGLGFLSTPFYYDPRNLVMPSTRQGVGP